MKTTLPTIIGSTLFATGVIVSLAAVPAQAQNRNNRSLPSNPPTPEISIPSFTLLDTKTFEFSNIFLNATTQVSDNKNGDGIVSQFNFDVSKTSNNKVLFRFENTGLLSNSFISQIQFSDPSKILNFNVFAPNFNVGDVKFEANTQNLAQSNNITDWVNSFGFASVKQGAGKDGIDKSERLALLFDSEFDKVISSLNGNQLRIGMHVQGIGLTGGGSDSFVSYVAPPAPIVTPVVTAPTPVPTPPPVETVTTVPTPPPVEPVATVPTPPPVETPAAEKLAPEVVAVLPPAAQVPEPTTLVGLAVSFGGILVSRRRKSHE